MVCNEIMRKSVTDSCRSSDNKANFSKTKLQNIPSIADTLLAPVDVWLNILQQALQTVCIGGRKVAKPPARYVDAERTGHGGAGGIDAHARGGEYLCDHSDRGQPKAD